MNFVCRQRARKESLSQDELNRHQMVLKEWTSYKCKQSVMEAKMIDRITASQQKALDQLRLISEPLYMEAIQVIKISIYMLYGNTT